MGVNPYKYGVVGATDIHNGLSTSEESAFASFPFGIDPKTMLPRGEEAKIALGIKKVPAVLDMDAVVNHPPPTTEDTLMFSSGGVTGVWAEQNSRNAIFAALKRKETFATSGTRIRVRLFGGWNYDAKMIEDGGWVGKAYAEGVPMGSDLPAKPASATAPKFVVQAVKDPDGANLDRIQIIKLWLDGGSYKESFRRRAVGQPQGQSEDGQGALRRQHRQPEDRRLSQHHRRVVLTAVWQDPEFDASKPAVYYARTLEIPTPRWSTLLAVKNHLPIPKSVAATIQERAWTSPVWFTPSHA